MSGGSAPKRSKSDVEAENLRLHEALEFLASQTTSLKAMGFWTQPEVEQAPEEARITVKNCWGDSLNCGVQEVRALKRAKDDAAALKSQKFQEQVAINRENAHIKLEIQAMSAEDFDSDSKKLGANYKKLNKRAACFKIIQNNQ